MSDFEDFEGFEDFEDLVEDPKDETVKPVEDAGKEEGLQAAKQLRPGRLYVTGIVTGILLVMLVFLVLDIFDLHPFSSTPKADAIYDLTKTVENYIDRYYWKSDADADKFAAYAAKGMVAALNDPYSVFYTESEMDTVKQKNDGDYVGIGVSIAEDTSKRKIITKVGENSPAHKAGMKVGDVVVAVDDKDVTMSSVDDIVEMIRGKAGQEHRITVLRSKNAASGQAVSPPDSTDDAERLTLTVVTEDIVNTSVHNQMLRDKVGYIKITSFDRETPKQFDEAIAALDKEQMKSLIIDVRNNGGGVLSAVLSVLDRLLPAGDLLTETRKGQKDTVYKSTDEKHFDKPMTVLINSKSASAAEVFAGALQDRLKVKLVGEKSFGKGIMQSIYRLADGKGGIKLTTGEYLLPSGRSIHEKGLTPDVEVKFDGSDKDYGTNADTQLKKALELIRQP